VTVRKSILEIFESTICIDVINDNRTAYSSGCPRSINLKSNIVLAVKTVVNEKIDLAQPAQKLVEVSRSSL